MTPEDFQITEDMTNSHIQTLSSIKTGKTHSSSSKSKRKSHIYGSFSYDTSQQPKTQNNSKEVSQSQSNKFDSVKTNRDKMLDLFILQKQLQKQYLMLVKQQSQRSKFIRQIQQEMKNYYSLQIQMKEKSKKFISLYQQQDEQNITKPQNTIQKPKNKIVTDDGFDNCANFIKEVVITTSRYYQVAITLLMNCTICYNRQEKGSIYIDDYLCLIDLFVNFLYEQVSQTDPFLKQITKLMCSLLVKLPELQDQEKSTLITNIQSQRKRNKQIHSNFQKIIQIFTVYMEKQQIQDYFEILTNSMLKKIEKISFKRAQNRNRIGISLEQSTSIADTQNSIALQNELMTPGSSFGLKYQKNWLEYFKPFQSFHGQKRALAISYLSQIYSEADLCPINLKIVLRYFYQSQISYLGTKYPQKLKNQINQIASLRVWQLIQFHYLKGFEIERANGNYLFNQMSTSEKQILKQIVNMIRNFFRRKNKRKYLEDDKLLEVYKKSKRFIIKVVQKIMSCNQLKYESLKQLLAKNEISADFLETKKNQSEMKNAKKVEADQVENYRKTLNSMEVCLFQENKGSLEMIQEMNSCDKELKINLPSQLMRIYGGCISFKQIKILLTSMKRISSLISNERIVNRVERIFNMSPGLQFLTKHKLVKHPNQIQYLYVILLEHQLDDLISNDYRNLYSKEYENDQVKNMIRQIMCELKLKQISVHLNKRKLVNKQKVNFNELDFSDLISFKKDKRLSPMNNKYISNEKPFLLMSLLENISQKCSQSVEGTQVEFSLHKGVSLQLLKKIKYLLYLFQKKSQQLCQAEVLQQMLCQVKLRNLKMVKIYEHTKFGLLAAIGNIKHYKNLLISKKEIDYKVCMRIRNITLLDELNLNICLTSPFTRNHPEYSLKNESYNKQSPQNSFLFLDTPRKVHSSTGAFSSFTKQKHQIEHSPPRKLNLVKEEEPKFLEPFNKYKYRISNADQIVLCETSECIHKDNIFMGLSYHANSIQQFIEMFSNLREVRENIYFASFIVQEKVSQRIYKQLSQRIKHCYTQSNYLEFEFMNKNYQKLNYSIDKINSVIYGFFDYIMNEKLSHLKITEKKNQIIQLKKVIKDIILRGIHERLVKKIQIKFKFNLDNKQKISLQKQENNILRQTLLTNHGIQDFKNKSNLFQDFEVQNQIDGDETAIESQFDQNFFNEKAQSTLSRESIKNSQKQQTFQDNKKRHKKEPEQHFEDTDEQTIAYQSINDMTFIFQMQAIRNSRQFGVSLINHSYEKQSQSKNLFNTKKQLQEVCSRYIQNINSKQTPQQKIQLLKNISDIFKLVIKEEKLKKQNHNNHHNENNLHKQSSSYSLQKLMFRSLIIAEPENWITNLAQNCIYSRFIEMFLHKDKILSMEGKILDQFKIITQHIFEMKELKRYLDIKDNQKFLLQSQDYKLKNIMSKIKMDSVLESCLP